MGSTRSPGRAERSEAAVSSSLGDRRVEGRGAGKRGVDLRRVVGLGGGASQEG